LERLFVPAAPPPHWPTFAPPLTIPLAVGQEDPRALKSGLRKRPAVARERPRHHKIGRRRVKDVFQSAPQKERCRMSAYFKQLNTAVATEAQVRREEKDGVGFRKDRDANGRRLANPPRKASD
jgi:hypothetical protein